MKKTILQNLSWILICSIIAKVLGGVYRIVLTRILGTDIGLFQIVFSVYSFLIILISSGIPMAISKIVSSKNTNSSRQKVLYGAISILFTISGILAIALIFGSKGLALLQGDKRIYLCYIILAPSLILSAGVAVLKGYFQGVKNFTFPAISAIIEQLLKVILGLIFMLVLQKFYILGALFGAMLGTLCGDIASFVFLKVMSRKEISFKYSIKNINSGKKVFKLAYPIMLYSLIIPLTNFIDSFLVVKLLNLNVSRNTSILLYGLQNGAVGSIISIPTIFSFALASVLMPSLSGDYANKKINQFNTKVQLAFKLAVWVALPCAIYFAINASNIINILYGTSINGHGVNGQYVAKILLIINSISVVFSCINQLSAVILQNLEKNFLPIINLGIGVLCKIILELMFIPCGRLGIYAYALATSVGFIISGVLNLYAIERFTNKLFDKKFLAKLTLACSIVILLLTMFKMFNSNWIFILGSLFTAVIYLVIIYLLKLFSKRDIDMFMRSD